MGPRGGVERLALGVPMGNPEVVGFMAPGAATMVYPV